MSVPIDLTATHLRVARAAARDATQDHSLALVAIVFGAAAFEGWLASFVTHASRHAQHDRGPIDSAAEAISEILPSLERTNAQWSLKLQVACALLTGRALNRGIQPWQDIDLLFRIRNSVIHPSLIWAPTVTDEHDSQPHSFVKSLVSRGVIEPPNPLPGIPGTKEEHKLIHAPASIALLQPAVATWAVQTAECGLKGVAALCPPSIFKKQIDWWLDETFKVKSV